MQEKQKQKRIEELVYRRTVYNRTEPSLSAKLFIKKGFAKEPILDWGCGYGYDVKFYKSLGLVADGFDPFHYENKSLAPFEHKGIKSVSCTYVLNVLPLELRTKTIKNIYNFLPDKGIAFLTVRTFYSTERERRDNWKEYDDGWLTKANTFKKGFIVEEFTEYVKEYFQEVKVIRKEPIIILAIKKP